MKAEPEFVASEIIERDRVRAFSVAELIALIPGTSRRTWLALLIPQLIARGVLRKIGRKFAARPSSIESAILADDITAARRQVRTR